MLIKSINMRLFGTSGIRRVVDLDLLRLALQVGWATGILYNNVIVGRDTRTSGSALRHAVMAGLTASGARCSDAGILPTPTLALAARGFKAGIMITASHNPPQYNGLKLLNPDGSAFSPAQQRELEELVKNFSSSSVKWDGMQTGDVYSTALEQHISRIREDFPGSYKLKVVVDCGCGAAFFITPHLLTQMGCEVTSLYCYPDGIFPRDMEPVEANLEHLKTAVIDSGAALGIAHDGDADRMMAVDDLGRFIPGDKLMIILATDSRVKSLVTTVDASMALDEMNFRIRRTRVGDPYVSEELKNGGDFGGEPSGAWIFPNSSLCPDGIYAAARIVAIASRRKLSEIVDRIPSYPVIRESLVGTITDMTLLKDHLLQSFNPLSSDTTDGLKLIFDYGWLLVRPSGTEPKIRLTVEARDEVRARQLYEKAANVIIEYIQR